MTGGRKQLHHYRFVSWMVIKLKMIFLKVSVAHSSQAAMYLCELFKWLSFVCWKSWGIVATWWTNAVGSQEEGNWSNPQWQLMVFQYVCLLVLHLCVWLVCWVFSDISTSSQISKTCVIKLILNHRYKCKFECSYPALCRWMLGMLAPVQRDWY